MAWKRIVQTIFAAASLSAMAGCACFCSETRYDCENCPPPDPCYGAYRGDFGGLLNAPCRGPYGYGPGHCGLVGFTKQMGTEFDAMVHVLASDRWYGGYPYGTCGPWVGRWESCCGCGGMADPCACCNGTPAGQPPAEQ
jgi:hypothetical protein